MKLREKIQLASEIPLYDGEKERLEKIADDFAVCFAEWFDDLSEDYCKDYTVKELLEIYKKEKGL